MMGGLLDLTREQYDEMGFDTLPLIPGSKKPLARAWQIRSPDRLWLNAPKDANIGIRAGGEAQAAVIDCDEYKCPGTSERVTSWLYSLGYQTGDYPLVKTQSGIGRHIYIAFSGGLSGDARDLSKDIGAGEFRYGAGSYVVAPPSVIHDGGMYALLDGDFARLPNLEPDDVLPILGNQAIDMVPKTTLPRRAVALLHGKSDRSYQSRSHFDESLIASLINAGHTFESVLELFENNETSGKYYELKTTRSNKAALHYLRRSYTEAQKWTQAHESKARRFALAMMEWAESNPWPGRTGAVDQLVYLAHASIAYKAGRLNYAAACRDLAELAGIGKTTATRATWRLCNSGLIIPNRKAVADSANIFQLGGLDKVGHSPRAPSVRKCPTLSNHDVFRQGGLGKSAGQIWQALQEGPASIGELSKITGRHVKTIVRAIGRMRMISDPITGEYVPMIGSGPGDTCHTLPVDLDRIARILGTAGTAKRRQIQHRKERVAHRRALQKGRIAKTDNSSPSGDKKEV